jgi:6-phosphogluconolactonase
VGDAPLWVRTTAAIDAATVRLAAHLESVIATRGEARLAIPGGSAAVVVGRLRARLGSNWQSIAMTWVDERCAAFADEDSNRGAAYRDEALDEACPCAFELALYEDGESADAAVERVERVLADRFAGSLDATLLGMGPDGHVASLFPGRRWDGPARAIHVADSPKPPRDRITLTRSMLATAPFHLLLAMGDAKHDALERLLRGDPCLPVVGLPGLVVVTDQSVEDEP